MQSVSFLAVRRYLTDVGVGDGSIDVAIGDFNSDGNQDIATANLNAPGTVSIRMGDGSGGLSGTNQCRRRGRPAQRGHRRSRQRR